MRGTRIAVLAAVLLAAGCAGLTPSEDSEPIAAAPDGQARIAQPALGETGYALAGSARPTLNVTIHASVSGDVELNVNRPVSAELDVARYRRNGSAGPATVALVTAPAVDIGPQGVNLTRNPIAAAEPAALVGLAQGTYDVSGLSESGTRTVTMLGEETTMTIYAGTTTQGGESIEVTVAVATVQADGDSVTLVSVAPAGVDETGRLTRLAEGVEYG